MPLGLQSQHTLFCSVTGHRLAEAYARRLMPHLAIRAGTAKRVHAHGLRHMHYADRMRRSLPDTLPAKDAVFVPMNLRFSTVPDGRMRSSQRTRIVPLMTERCVSMELILN